MEITIYKEIKNDKHYEFKGFTEARKKAEEKVKELNLTEKIGQLSQFGTSIYTSEEKYFEDHLAEGKIGAYLTIIGADKTNKVQKDLVDASRLHIPALFGDDVIHGFNTTFPTPLAQSCSWNPEIVRRGCEVAAKEAYRSGIKWTFSPMVDIARDPRWGRVVEGYGEDTYLCSRMSEAAVKGYQGEGETLEKDHVFACMKHFIGYGAAIGGRDYNSAEISDQHLHDVYLPPFAAGIEAGAATVMTAFEDINGTPATANKYILKDILRDELGFEGMVVSDAGATSELTHHGFAENEDDAAIKAFNAGCDMSMQLMGDYYNHGLPVGIKEGRVSVEDIDESVTRVLTLKYLCGIMDDPYTDESVSNEAFSDEHMKATYDAAIECAVLLENDGALPVKNAKRIALIGALAAFSFTAITVAIVNIVKYRKYHSPVWSASKALSFVAALVSMLTLEDAMLATFGQAEGEGFRQLMGGLSGAGVTAAVLAIAIYMIVVSTKK